MDDLISRQAAIDAIRTSTSKYTGFMEMEMYTDDDAVEAINGVPSAKQWIPCSERLPIGQEEVIVSCHDDSGDTPFDYTSCGWVTTDWEYWIVDNEINNHVIAWMPLPEPLRLDGE